MTMRVSQVDKREPPRKSPRCCETRRDRHPGPRLRLRRRRAGSTARRGRAPCCGGASAARRRRGRRARMRATSSASSLAPAGPGPRAVVAIDPVMCVLDAGRPARVPASGTAALAVEPRAGRRTRPSLRPPAKSGAGRPCLNRIPPLPRRKRLPGLLHNKRRQRDSHSPAARRYRRAFSLFDPGHRGACWRSSAGERARVRDRHRQSRPRDPLGQHRARQLRRFASKSRDPKIGNSVARRRRRLQLRQGRRGRQAHRPAVRIRHRLQEALRRARQRRRLVRRRLRRQEQVQPEPAAGQHPELRRQPVQQLRSSASTPARRRAARRLRLRRRRPRRRAGAGQARPPHDLLGRVAASSAATCTASPTRRTRSTCRRASRRRAPKPRSCSGR